MNDIKVHKDGSMMAVKDGIEGVFTVNKSRFGQYLLGKVKPNEDSNPVQSAAIYFDDDFTLLVAQDLALDWFIKVVEDYNESVK